MNQEDLLNDEHIEEVLTPHPFSFMKLQSLCIFPIFWGLLLLWLVNFSEYTSLFQNPWLIIITWAIVMLLVAIIASLVTIQWSIFFLYLATIAGGIGLVLWQNWLDTTNLAIPIYTIIISIIGFLIVELYRRSHKYIITNLRIVFQGGVVTKRERTVRYDKITDIDGQQGILGQIFKFGTIIPISQSGFGLGSDKSFAGGGAEIAPKKIGFFGFFGGGKDVQTPRARSYYELHGVRPYKKIRKLIENLVQGSVITPYQQEQVAFQKEQVDLQKQMRDLLKKQNSLNDEEDDTASSET